ncbi:MAG: conjugal transfer protein TraB [Ideonella sp. MAG2]|nr:MAG: conjugal transfer protein TraB [Ideonella sp. MAG2]
MRIPLYSEMTPKRQQQVHMVMGGLAFAGLALFVSSFIGGSDGPTAPGSPKDMPKPRTLAQVPGAQLDSRDVWVGHAAKEVAKMKDDLKASNDQARRQEEEQKRLNNELMERIKQMQEQAKTSPSAALPATAIPNVAASAPAVQAPPALAAPKATAPGLPSATGGLKFPSQAGLMDKLPAPNPAPSAGSNSFPPGTPNAWAAGGFPQGLAEAPVRPAAPRMVQISLNAHKAAGSSERSQTEARGLQGGATRRLESFLPVGFVKAEILGGIAAPTGGQAQGNPVPALLRLKDAAVLPNRYRAQVRDCFVVAEGYGDQSAERAYLRTVLLSCVMRDGSVLETKLSGSVFGEDGMNGVMGRLVTKQGAILTNALLSGIAAGLGQGIAQATQTVNTTPLGTTTIQPTDPNAILKSGMGTGVGKALDRLSQYYINLAERTFPVIEVLPGRTVDIVITQGVQLEVPLNTPSATARSGSQERHDLMRAALEDQE